MRVFGCQTLALRRREVLYGFENRRLDFCQDDRMQSLFLEHPGLLSLLLCYEIATLYMLSYILDGHHGARGLVERHGIGSNLYESLLGKVGLFELVNLLSEFACLLLRSTT